ncbi:MAG: hypothetical protein M3Z05_11825 [Gemmatimonadota bacterium]|nr:hypothetical protein [Gemmatimonadota bacterium]
MPEAPRPPVPSPSIDRSSVDRILARALELQASTSADPDGRLTEAQLESLAKEVGLDPLNLRQALAEERTRVEAPAMERGLLASLYGSSGVSAQRTVRGTLAPVLKALDDWMQREELLIPQRYFTERIVWEARTDFASRMKRATSGRGHALARATTVGATVVTVDTDRVLVRLDAHLGGYRSLMVNQNAAAATVGVVSAAALTVIIPVIFAAAPAVLLVGGGFALARGSHLKSVTRAQLALEQVLDRLERGEAGRATSLLGALASAVVGRPR